MVYVLKKKLYLCTVILCEIAHARQNDQALLHSLNRNIAIDYGTNRFYILVWSDGSSLYCYLLDIFCSKRHTQLWHPQGAQSLHLA